MYIITEIIDRELCSQFVVENFEKATEMAERMFIGDLKDYGYTDEVIEEYASHYVTENIWNYIDGTFGYEIGATHANYWISIDFNVDIYVERV